MENRPNLNETPMGSRLTIGIFGKRNAGKSTLMNALTKQQISVVSDVAGTTTDPVYKAMELLPLGPISLVDTAGFDDMGELGELRIEKTKQVLRTCNLAVYVVEAGSQLAREEQQFLEELKARSLPYLVFENDKNWTEVQLDNAVLKVKQQIIASLYKEEPIPSLVEGMVSEKDVVILVTPIDSAAPKGRMILPQQQTIRDILDKNAMAMVVKETELESALSSFTRPPALVITDSQAFSLVDRLVPKSIPLTSFSMLFARLKGDLQELRNGVKAMRSLKEGDKVLIVEGCTHHRQKDDIGTVKIPTWIREATGKEIVFEWASGTSFPKELGEYSLIIHCGACMLPANEMKYRMEVAKEQGIPMTNYGMLIADAKGILERAIKPFQ